MCTWHHAVLLAGGRSMELECSSDSVCVGRQARALAPTQSRATTRLGAKTSSVVYCPTPRPSVRYTDERLEYYEFLCASNDAIYYFVCVMLMGRGTENDKHKIPESL